MALNINGTTGISGVDGSASAPVLTGTDSNTGINFGSDIVNINTGGSTKAIFSTGTELYHNSTKHFETQSNGIKLDSAGDTVLELHTSNAGAHNRINFSVDAGDNYGGIWYSAGYNRMEFRTNNAERATIDSSGDLRVGRIYSNTTSGGANVRVQSDGLMQRDTSSRRYKNTIADATHGLADLNKLRPVTYKGNNDGDTVFGGLIAEEVHDAGLTEFVDYDSDNQPDALKYGNMVSLCIKAIQELSAKVETLETKVAALEAG